MSDQHKNTPFLSRLKSGKADELTLNQGPGVWGDGEGSQRVKLLAEAITTRSFEQSQMPNTGATTAEIHSVPDPWGRILLFANALYEDHHPMKQVVLGEWKGLLALLALHEIRGFKDVLDAATIVNLATFANQQPGNFARVLYRLLPSGDDLIKSDTNFNSFYLLKAKSQTPGSRGVVIGMTSPSTLVATGADYKNWVNRDNPNHRITTFDRQRVPWFDGAHLKDPIPYLNPQERTALAEWLWLLSNRIPRTPRAGQGEDKSREGKLLRLLEAYAMAADPSGDQNPDESVLVLPASAILSSPTGLYKLLSRPHSGRGEFDSELQIMTRRKDAKVLSRTNYILIDPAVATQFAGLKDRSGKPNEVVVYENLTLETAPSLATRERGISGEKRTSGVFHKAQDSRKPEVNWCTPDFLFEDILLYEPLSGKFPGCWQANTGGSSDPPPDSANRQILFPLRADALKLFSAQELIDNFIVQWDRDGNAICRLSLYVQAAKWQEVKEESTGVTAPALVEVGNPLRITIEKQYPKEKTNELERISPISIWPNFRFEDVQKKNRWQLYFLFQYWGLDDPESFAVKPLDTDGIDFQQTALINKRNNNQEERFEIFRMRRFPEALVCTASWGNLPHNTNTRRPQGLMFLKTPPANTPGSARDVSLGIDFGTTGTSVYWRYDGDQREHASERIMFSDRLFPVAVRSLDRVAFQRTLRQLFIPGTTQPSATERDTGTTQDGRSGNILSIYQSFLLKEGSHDKDLKSDEAGLAVRDGHVLFPTSDDIKDFFIGPDSSIHSDMKWGKTKEERLRSQEFLTQIGMQALAELVNLDVGRVNLLFSYPTAFGVVKDGGEDHTTMSIWNGNWTRVTKNLTEVTSIPIDLNIDPTRCPEAVAASRYFAEKEGLSANDGAVTLDIGGGTTDLAIWTVQTTEDDITPKLMAHLSVLFAGRDMFLAPLKVSPQILSILDSDIKLDALEAARKASDHKAYLGLLNAIIASHGETMREHLHLHDGEKHVREFLRILEIGLSGIGFYAGLVLGRLIQNGDYAIDPEGTVRIFVGGNGSKLFHWCDFGEFKQGTPFHTRFSERFRKGVLEGAPNQNDIKVAVTLSKDPKEEVASGLVAKREHVDPGNKYTDPMAGEVFQIGTKAERSWWFEPINEAVVKSGSVTIDKTLPVFSKFIESLDKSQLLLNYDSQRTTEYWGRIQRDLTGIANDLNGAHSGVPINAEAAKQAKAEAGDKLLRIPVFFRALELLLRDRIEGLRTL